MSVTAAALAAQDWHAVEQQLDAQGYAMLPGVFGVAGAQALARRLRARLGQTAVGAGAEGQRAALSEVLPVSLTVLRAALYRHVCGIANRWQAHEGATPAPAYPATWLAWQQRQRRAGQPGSSSYCRLLRPQEEVWLHAEAQPPAAFPLQLVAVLSAPGEDFQGGEFVLTEQRVRRQSRPMVVPLRLGDAALVATGQRPVAGAKGVTRASLKQAVSRVRAGERLGLTLSFDAGV